MKYSFKVMNKINTPPLYFPINVATNTMKQKEKQDESEDLEHD